MAWSQGVQVKGLQTRQYRMVLHDERCRRVLERVAKGAHGRPGLASAVQLLEREGVPAPNGKAWHRMTVWRIAKRLGIELGTGRAFNEKARCPRCNDEVPRLWGGECRNCRRRQGLKRKYRTNDLRVADLREAKAQLRYYQDKVDALSRGRRHYSRQHPEPKNRFGKPIK